MDEQNAVSEMYDAVVDVAAAQETLKRNLPPAGTYTTMLEDFEPSVTPVKFEGDDRQFFNVFVRASIKVKGQEEPVEQGLRFKFSQETRPATKFGTNEIIEGKDDSSSKRYAELVKAYLDWAGEDGEPLKTLGQLIEFIKATPLQIRTMQGDNGLNVTGIGYKRSAR